MEQKKAPLRFDHREIAVIFSLFIFVALLMFTVGILVGKGLAQARLDGKSVSESTEGGEHGDSHASADHHSSDGMGTSVTSPHEAAANPPGHDDHPEPIHASAAPHGAHHDEPAKEAEPLNLIPKHGKAGSGFKEPKVSNEAEHLLKDPKIQALLDEEAPLGKPSKHKARTTASLAPTAKKPTTIPHSFATGKFSVQVGSYPTEKDAGERVESLKKLGFPYAYFSAKELGDTKDTWYRVWLGYYPDYESARISGEMLQARGEVKNYLVRKTDTSG